MANATENRILYKVNNEIITSYDLKKEFKYLSIINPTIINLEKMKFSKFQKLSNKREDKENRNFKTR